MPGKTSDPRPLRVLVIGAGPAADWLHMPVLAGLRDRGEIVLVLVCDIQHARAAAARRKFGFLQDSGEAVAALERADIDAVYILGSAQLHYEYGMRALRNGKHLFVEKPVAPSYAQARELVDVARSVSVPEPPVGVSPKRCSTSPNFAILPRSAHAPGWAPTAFTPWMRCSS
jgi:predicted dehydrogenase